MRSRFTLVCLLAAGLFTQAAWADIYIWEDDDGTRHISNLNAPPHAELLLRTEEQPLEQAAAREQQAAEEEEAFRRAQARIREREAKLDRREAKLERRIEEAEEKVRSALEDTEDRVSAAEARYDRWEADRRYTYSTVTYIYRPYTYWRYPRKYLNYRWSHRPHSPSFARRPFPLESIHLPLGRIGHDHRRHPSPGDIDSRPRSHGEGAGRPHGHPGGRRH